MGLGFGVATPALALGFRAKGLGRAPAGAAEAGVATSAGIEAGVTLPPLGLGPPVGLATGDRVRVRAKVRVRVTDTVTVWVRVWVRVDLVERAGRAGRAGRRRSRGPQAS